MLTGDFLLCAGQHRRGDKSDSYTLVKNIRKMQAEG
jgi:hypothetical protein